MANLMVALIGAAFFCSSFPDLVARQLVFGAIAAAKIVAA
jgi:hypothetical protein